MAGTQNDTVLRIVAARPTATMADAGRRCSSDDELSSNGSSSGGADHRYYVG
jgi:hypothetical protein